MSAWRCWLTAQKCAGAGTHCPAEQSEDPLDAALDAERMRNGKLLAYLLPYESVQQRSRDRKGIRMLLYLFRGKFY